MTQTETEKIIIKEELVSFRNMVTVIPSTTYASHGMYYYPARFIPQVVRWAIDKYTIQGDWVIDPFAGSGTVCIESQITNRNSVNLDLSPLLEPLLEAKTLRNVSWNEIKEIGDTIINSKDVFMPKWTRITYWHPQEFLKVLSQMWGAYYKNPNSLVLIALFKTMKKFSFTDNVVPKLFKSKRKTEEVKQLLQTDYEQQIKESFLKILKKMFDYSENFTKYHKGGKYVAEGGINLLNHQLDKRKYKLLITSPPYGLAHEYIRSIKLELAWLNYSDREITDLINKEIPYNKTVPDIEIMSPTYHKYLPKISDNVRRYCITYFKSILFSLEKVMSRLTEGGIAAIFIGNATFSGVEIPYYRIFQEHFQTKGYNFERLLMDKIVTRRLFNGRKNPSPNGISYEYLLILKK